MYLLQFFVGLIHRFMDGYFWNNYIQPVMPVSFCFITCQQQDINWHQLSTWNYQCQFYQNQEISIADENNLEKPVEQMPQKENEVGENPIGSNIQGLQPKERKQVDGRNAHSNIFRSFFKFLTSTQFMEQGFRLIKKKYNLTILAVEFQKKMKELSKSFKNYVKKKQIMEFLQDILEEKINQEEKIIMRVMIDHYCKGIHILTTVHSKKILKNSRIVHLRELRSFRNQILYVAEMTKSKLSRQ